MMHGPEKSDLVIVAVKPANKVAFRRGAVRGGISRCGVGGAKDGDQGECGSAKHAPDSVPGARVTDAGPHAASLCRCGTAKRGADALPGSKATSRAKGSHRNLGGLGSGRRRRVRCAEYGGPHREGEEP